MQFSRPEDHDNIVALADQLKEKTEKVGLYLQDCTIATPDPDIAAVIQMDPQAAEQAVKDGAPLMLLTTFVIGDLAYSKRVQDPDQYAIDNQVQTMVPSEAEEFREKMLRRIAEGKPLFTDEEDD